MKSYSIYLKKVTCSCIFSPELKRDVANFVFIQNAFLSSLPFLVGFICTLTAGFFADKLRRGILSTKQTRRLMACLGKYEPYIYESNYSRMDKIKFAKDSP